MLTAKNCKWRMIMSEEFTVRKISWDIRDKISRLFEDITKQVKKEKLAEQIVVLLRQGMSGEILYNKIMQLVKQVYNS